MNADDIVERLQDLLIKNGVAYQIFIHDGWHFVAEPAASGQGFQVKLVFNFTYGYVKHVNGKWYSHTRMEPTQVRKIDADPDDGALLKIAQEMYAEATEFCWQHTPPRPID